MEKIKYTVENIESIYSQVASLYKFHINTVSYRHAVRIGDQGLKEPFIPTYFIYVYFIFNTLYSIDWEESLKKGYIWSLYGDELKKQDKFLEFILDFKFNFNKEFAKSYDSNFKKIFLKIGESEINYVKDKVILDIDHFPIQIRRRGSLNKINEIDAYKGAVDKILGGECINKDIIKSITTLIYRIRCNIFHGVKSLDDLNSGEECKKLQFYTNILIAVNQMIFSYLDFLSNKKTNTNYNTFDELWLEFTK